MLREHISGLRPGNPRCGSVGGECPIVCVRRLGLQVVRESVGVSHG